MDLYYIEDNPDIADTVKTYLEQRNFKVTICATLARARQAIQNHVPGVVLLDWNMPDGRGDSLCRWIRGNWKELPVIFLTVRGDSADIVSGFQNGADDYVVKPFELEVLYSRIRAVLRRTGNVGEQYLSCGGISIDTNRRQVICHSEEILLSAAEYQLLLYLMQHKGKTVTREKILEQVWDVDGTFVGENTVSMTVTRLRRKIEPDAANPVYIKNVFGQGYVFGE